VIADVVSYAIAVIGFIHAVVGRLFFRKGFEHCYDARRTGRSRRAHFTRVAHLSPIASATCAPAKAYIKRTKSTLLGARRRQ
jgi:hypothetical protein